MDRLVATFAALADPIRLAALQRLAQGPATAGQLASLFDVSRPAVSRHLGVLRGAGLVTVTLHGRHSWYEADTDELVDLGQWVHDVTKRITGAPRLNLGES